MTSKTLVVDTGPLVSAISDRDEHYASVVGILNNQSFRWVIPALCVAEASYMIAAKYGPLAEARFLASLQEAEVVAPTPIDFVRMAELVRQYADFPLGGTDASVVALAERLGCDTIVTLDRRHFRAVRPLHCEAFRILPE